MKSQESHRRETEALIEAIWGTPSPAIAVPAPNSTHRARQNAALAAAMRAYLQQYLHEVGREDAGSDDDVAALNG